MNLWVKKIQEFSYKIQKINVKQKYIITKYKTRIDGAWVIWHSFHCNSSCWGEQLTTTITRLMSFSQLVAFLGFIQLHFLISFYQLVTFLGGFIVRHRNYFLELCPKLWFLLCHLNFCGATSILVISFLSDWRTCVLSKLYQGFCGEENNMFSWVELGCYCVSQIVSLLFPLANHRCLEPYMME